MRRPWSSRFAGYSSSRQSSEKLGAQRQAVRLEGVRRSRSRRRPPRRGAAERRERVGASAEKRLDHLRQELLAAERSQALEALSSSVVPAAAARRALSSRGRARPSAAASSFGRIGLAT